MVELRESGWVVLGELNVLLKTIELADILAQGWVMRRRLWKYLSMLLEDQGMLR